MNRLRFFPSSCSPQSTPRAQLGRQSPCPFRRIGVGGSLELGLDMAQTGRKTPAAHQPKTSSLPGDPEFTGSLAAGSSTGALGPCQQELAMALS